jgi:hypothetical protein
MRLGSTWVLVLALGCSSSEAGPNASGGGQAGTSAAGSSSGGADAGAGGAGCAVTLDGRAEPVFEQPTSRIRVFAGSYYTVVEGVVLDGQRREIHTESARRGNCRLLTYDSPSFCDPACENPELCVGGVCERFPVPISAGTLSVGLGPNRTVNVPPSDLGHYYWGTEDFGFDALASVTLSAPGDAAPAFDLVACLSPAPRPTSEWNQLLQRRTAGEDVELAWSNPVPTARVYLRMTTCIGTHGGISPVEVECEAPDVGKLILPGAYLDALYEDGWGRGECGGNDVRRYHASQSGSGDEAVQLRAESIASFWFQPSR